MKSKMPQKELTRVAPEGWWGKKHVREIRIGYVLLVLLYVFVILIPSLYQANTKIPPYSNLEAVSGELICKKIGNKGNYLTGIRNVNGEYFFTCANGKLGAYPDCVGPTIKACETFADKQATIWWYAQPVYLFTTQDRLVRLMVNGEEIIGHKKTVEHARAGATMSTWFMFVMLGLFILIVIGFERMIRRYGHE